MSATGAKPAANTVLVMRLGNALHALPVHAVEEVLPALAVEPVPQSPEFVRGVIFVRGHLIPVLSAAERLGLKDHCPPDEPVIVCLRVGGRLVGVEFDEALDLLDLGPAPLLPASDLGAQAGFFAGVVAREGTLIRVLDPDKLAGLVEAVQPDPARP